MLALVGNPNVGKTVLFNKLTTSYERVGNWNGVTTDKKIKEISFGKEHIKVVDLPGCYNLSGVSLEERITAEFLKNNDCNIINICDSRNLERNLYLTLLLLEQGKKLLLFVNDYSKYASKFDVKALSALLGVDILAQNAQKTIFEDVYNKNFLASRPKYCDDKFALKDGSEQIAIRYRYIEELLEKCEFKRQKPKCDTDNILLGKMALPLFMLFFAAFFYICFGPVGSFLSDSLSYILDIMLKKPIVSLLLYMRATPFVYSLVVDGIISSAFGLMEFVPQIALVGFMSSFIEESGYLSRIAFLFEGLLSKIGLSGKSVLSLLISFGCNTTALFTTGGQEDNKAKIKLSLLLPFVCCSAKLPIVIIFTKVLYDSFGFLVAIAIYVLVFAIGVALVFVVNKYFVKPSKKSFLLELTNYKLPSIKSCLKESLKGIKNYFVKIGTIIFVSSLLIWTLQNFDFAFRYNQENSMLKVICLKLCPIFAPIGLNNWVICASLVIGIFAKELSLTTLCLICGIGVSDLSLLLTKGFAATFTPLTFIIYVLFVCLYSPCLSFLAALSKSVGKKWGCICFLINTLIAYLICSVVYLFGRLLVYNFSIFLIIVLFLLAIIVILLRFFGKDKCERCFDKNCSKCNK